MYCKFICKNIQKSMVTFCSYVLLSFKKGHPQNNSTVPPTASSLAWTRELVSIQAQMPAIKRTQPTAHEHQIPGPGQE